MYWWGVPSLGLMSVSDFLTLFLLYYYNQILGLSAALAGLALFICVVFDAISDPVIAYWSDRHKGEFGRRIPFMFAGILPMTLSCLALFVIELGDAQWILFTQLAVLMLVFQVSNTVFAVPRFALSLRLRFPIFPFPRFSDDPIIRLFFIVEDSKHSNKSNVSSNTTTSYAQVPSPTIRGNEFKQVTTLGAPSAARLGLPFSVR